MPFDAQGNPLPVPCSKSLILQCRIRPGAARDAAPDIATHALSARDMLFFNEWVTLFRE